MMPPRVLPASHPGTPVIGDRASFGAHIRATRTRRGLRIDDAAALCGVSVQLLDALERGTRSVGLEKALHVATQLGVAILAVSTEDLPDALRALERPSS